MLTKKIKNNTGSDLTLVGQVIPSGVLYQIQPEEENRWMNNADVESEILTSGVIVNDGDADITNTDAAMVYMKSLSIGVGACVYPEGELTAANGWSGAIPFTNTEFDEGGIHDNTVSTSGTATGTHSSTTLQDTGKSWTTDEHADSVVRITAGTGLGQFRKIASNTSDTLTVPAFTVTPDNTSVYEVTKYSTRLTAPIKGMYHVRTTLNFYGNNTGLRGVRFDINGAFKFTQYSDPVSAVECGRELSRMYKLAAGDYIEVQGYQSTGDDLKYNPWQSRMYFQMLRIGG